MWTIVKMKLGNNRASDIVKPSNLVRVVEGKMKPTHRVINYRWYLIKKNKTPIVMDMFQEVKGMCEKVDVNFTLLVPVTGENMSSTVIAFGATSLEASGIVFDEMRMTLPAVR